MTASRRTRRSSDSRRTACAALASLALVAIGALGTLGTLGALGGCASDPTKGYASVSPYPTKYQSVAAPIFRNQSYMRGFELDLADALVKEIESSTPYKVRSEASADTVLRGTLTSIDLVELSKDPSTGLANEMMVRVRADFEWVDLRSGERIVAKQGIESSALFVPSYPAREPLELGRFAAVQQLARDLVGAMQSKW
ncbi:MAG: LPS assembly lipoprotein LptE [bacterium]